MVRDLTGKTLVQCNTFAGSTALHELAKKAKEAKPEWKHRGIKFVFDGRVVACGTEIHVLLADQNLVSLTAIAEERPSVEEVLHDGHAMFLMLVGDDAQSLDVPLTEMGVDSLQMIDLKKSLEQHFDVRMSSTALFDYPTIRELSEYVHERIQDS